MKKLNFNSLVLLILLTSLSAYSGELVSWSEKVSENFDAKKCITIKGIPGTPRKCAPSYTQKYPCPSFKHPHKKCKHTIGGACTPGTPGTPDKKECANANLGNFSFAVDGGVYSSFSGIGDDEIAISTTVSVGLFGKHASLPITCKINIGKKVNICLNLLTRTFDIAANSGYSCEIAGASSASLSTPGVVADFCMNVQVDGVSKKPTGSVGASLNTSVNFGGAKVAGKGISLGSKAWKPKLFSVKF